MNTPATADGILLQTYPAKLSHADLQWLEWASTSKLAAKAPKYMAWVQELVRLEKARRQAEDTSEPLEVCSPRFNASRWTGESLAQALEVSGVAIELFDDRPEIVALLKKLDKILRVWAILRLREVG